MPLTDVKYLGGYKLELIFESGRKKIKAYVVTAANQNVYKSILKNKIIGFFLF